MESDEAFINNYKQLISSHRSTIRDFSNNRENFFYWQNGILIGVEDVIHFLYLWDQISFSKILPKQLFFYHLYQEQKIKLWNRQGM